MSRQHDPVAKPLVSPSPRARQSYRYPLLLLWIFGILLVGVAWQAQIRNRTTKAPQRTVTPRGDLQPDEKATIELFRRSSPSVVNVTAFSLRRAPFSRDVMQVLSNLAVIFIQSVNFKLPYDFLFGCYLWIIGYTVLEHVDFQLNRLHSSYCMSQGLHCSVSFEMFFPH